MVLSCRWPDLADQAQSNSLDSFRLVFDKKFLQTIVTLLSASRPSSDFR